jgi:beta-mannosidase
MELKPDYPLVDDDPWPRPAPVGAGSVYAPVSSAVVVPPSSVEVAGVVDAAGWDLGAPARSDLVDWTFSGPSGSWPVTVPDTWSRRDPALADFRGPCSYERVVEASGPFARVVLDGVDYLASVFVDGALAFTHEGGFTPIAVDVPTGRPVAVKVVVDDPVEPEMLEPDPLLRPKRKIKGVFEEHDSRPGGMSIGSHYDASVWGVRWGSGGVSGPARLEESGVVRLDAVFVTAVPGSLRVNWVLTNLGDSAVDVEVRSAVADSGLVVAARLAPGASRVAVRLVLVGEEHWSPERPVLYRLTSAVVVDGAVSDVRAVDFGVRSVEMAVSGPSQFQLRLNGERTYVRAANYIPGVFASELSASLLRRDAELAKEAGLNSLGVHAGVCPGAVAAADEVGLLIYQDFPLQWSYDPAGGPLFEGGPTFAEASSWLAAELAYRFYNHPSVVYWCGHNEPAYQLREAFGTVNVPELLGLVDTMDGCPNEESLDLERAAVLARVDPSRPVSAVSGLGASRDDGDNHDYTGSLSGGHATNSGTGTVPFVSEFGAWSANFSAAGVGGAGSAGFWPPSEADEVRWYEQTHLYSTQVTYAGRPSRFEDFQTWCFAGQLWAGWHAKVVSEKARLAKWSPSGAHRYHFFLDHFGDGGAGVVDRHRTVGPAYGGLAAANRPVAALAPFPVGGRVVPGSVVRLPVFVVNDLSSALGPVEVSWQLCALDGDDDCWLVGRDDPERPGPLQGELAPSDQVCVIPRRFGRVLASGVAAASVGADALVQVDEVVWTASWEGPVALFMTVGNGAPGWTSFMVAADGWSPVPGLTGRARFAVSGPGAGAGSPGSLVRRWTGEPVPSLDAVPPDQYLLDGVPVNVFDDVRVAADGTVERASPLPW